jgi:ATP-binding cassette subfamily C (CFTR/MRP) protein 1
LIPSFPFLISLSADMVTQFAQNEQNMNAVERVLHYTELEPEGERSTPNDPPPSWPSEGGISFSNVELVYREGLPLVLKDISFHVKAGEKASGYIHHLNYYFMNVRSGRHCRTNRSWKEFSSPSSIPVGFLWMINRECVIYYLYFSTVELRGGKIEIDGRNIRDMGLDILRTRLALVPQDGTLFLGTLRENL